MWETLSSVGRTCLRVWTLFLWATRCSRSKSFWRHHNYPDVQFCRSFCRNSTFYSTNNDFRLWSSFLTLATQFFFVLQCFLSLFIQVLFSLGHCKTKGKLVCTQFLRYNVKLMFWIRTDMNHCTKCRCYDVGLFQKKSFVTNCTILNLNNNGLKCKFVFIVS